LLTNTENKVNKLLMLLR